MAGSCVWLRGPSLARRRACRSRAGCDSSICEAGACGSRDDTMLPGSRRAAERIDNCLRRAVVLYDARNANVEDEVLFRAAVIRRARTAVFSTAAGG
jgi:hypothetical protein